MKKQFIFELQQNETNYQRKVQVNSFFCDLAANNIEFGYTLFSFEKEKEIVKLRTTDIITARNEKVDANGVKIPLETLLEKPELAETAQTAFEFWINYICLQSFEPETLLMQIVDFQEKQGTFNI